jgi:hypothetical protein
VWCAEAAGGQPHLRDSRAVLSWLLLALFVAGCILLIWLSRRIEPHWVSRDGQRFTCRVADLAPEQGEVGPWTEARVAVTGEGDEVTVAMKPKLFRKTSRYRPIELMHVEGRADSDDSGLIVYLLSGEGQMALRVPKRSRAVKTLDELAATKG